MTGRPPLVSEHKHQGRGECGVDSGDRPEVSGGFLATDAAHAQPALCDDLTARRGARQVQIPNAMPSVTRKDFFWFFDRAMGAGSMDGGNQREVVDDYVEQAALLIGTTFIDARLVRRGVVVRADLQAVATSSGCDGGGPNGTRRWQLNASVRQSRPAWRQA
jgi:hypothetical protein